MKVIRVHEFGPPSVMRLEEVDDPKPGDRQVLVRIRAIGVNPVDTYMRSGAYAALPSLPFTPGSDAAGIVEAVGTAVWEFAPGDRVYICGTAAGRSTGAYGELAICEIAQVYRLPDNVSFSQGAAVGVPYATAYRALFQRAQALPGETVLVHGASGGVGLAALQIGRAHGLKTIGTAGSARGLQLISEQGATHALNHRVPNYVEQLVSLTNGRGVDVIVEMLANVNLDTDLTILAPHGRVVVVGCRGTVEINPRQAMVRDAVILGMLLFNATPEDLALIHAALGAGLANGTLSPVIARELPLAEAPRAHQLVLEPGASGKIVLVTG